MKENIYQADMDFSEAGEPETERFILSLSSET